MSFLFKKTDELISQIDHFIDLTAQSGLHFNEGVRFYLDRDEKLFEERLEIIRDVEKKADSQRQDVESKLYVQTLIPDSRGDVLGILESIDTVIDRVKFTTLEFSIERPGIPTSMRDGFLSVTEMAVNSIEALAATARSYFYDVYTVKDNFNKVKFYERESDRLSEAVKRKIFNTRMSLARKNHLGMFIRHIDSLADKAETAADRLSIAAIKRIV